MLDLEHQLAEALGENYRIERPLASGGMGHVFLGRDLRHANRAVAIKVLSTEVASAVGAQRFQREIEIVSTLENAHIVPIFDSGTRGDLLYFVMPWVEGESLDRRLEREGRLPIPEALRVISQVLQALEYAHARGVVHRDIKPANILLSGRDARLTDFGIARAAGERLAQQLTQTGNVVGTPMYMSPEQALGREADARSDLYAAGCVLFEMLTGSPPWMAETAYGTLEKRLRERAPSARAARPEVPEMLDRVLRRFLEREPEARFASATEAARALESAVAPVDLRLTRLRLTWPVAAVSAAVLAAAVGLRWWPSELPKDSTVTLAVLPLDNVSGDLGQDWFADAMTSELIRELSRVPGLRVIARTSVLPYRDSSRRSRDLARELGAEALLEGTIQRAGKTVRISATLVDGRTENSVWSEKYDGAMDDVLQLQSDVARDIARGLHVRLAPKSEGHPAGSDVDPRAYEAYLEGRAAWNHRTLAGFQEAIGHYERAIALSPRLAAAHAGLADVYTLIWFYGVMPAQEAYGRAQSAAATALAIDSTCADAWASLGVVHSEQTWNWAEGERAFRQALRWNPNHAPAHQWYSEFLAKLGRTDEALAQILIARGLDPLSPLVRGHIATTYYFRREPELALREFESATRIDSTYWLTRLYRGLTLAQLARTQEAAAELRSAILLAPGNSLPPAALGYVLGRAGDTPAARATLEALMRPEERDRVPPSHLALVYLGLGDHPRSLEQLERAVESRDPLASFLYIAPALDPLRAEPRFQTLLRRLALPQSGSPDRSVAGLPGR